MLTLLPASVGLGLMVSLLFTELFGLAAGGLIVPGYIALELDSPLTVALTFGVGLLTYGIIEGLSRRLILFGRRRTALTILLGYLMGFAARGAAEAWGQPGADVIGFIIPGLIAMWMSRQGVLTTVASILMVSVMVRLILIATLGEAMLP